MFVKARLRFGVVRANGRQAAASHGSAIFGFVVDISGLAEKVDGIVMRKAQVEEKNERGQ